MHGIRGELHGGRAPITCGADAHRRSSISHQRRRSGAIDSWRGDGKRGTTGKEGRRDGWPAGRRGRPHHEGRHRHRHRHQAAMPRHSPTDLSPARQALNQGAGPRPGRSPPPGPRFRPSACGLTSTGNDRPKAAARRALRRLSTSLSRASQQGYPRNLCRTRGQSAAAGLLNACRFGAKRLRGRRLGAGLGKLPLARERRARWLLSTATGRVGVAVVPGIRAVRPAAIRRPPERPGAGGSNLRIHEKGAPSLRKAPLVMWLDRWVPWPSGQVSGPQPSRPAVFRPRGCSKPGGLCGPGPLRR